MKIAFTAPMKPLDHPVPSGDRTMGRLIVKALESLGHEVTIASRFRSWRKDGSDSIQSEVRNEALAEADRISADWQQSGYRPDLFLTYHLYHKAPDWIGPALADRFDLPYAIVEASRAPKRQQGDFQVEQVHVDGNRELSRGPGSDRRLIYSALLTLLRLHSVPLDEAIEPADQRGLAVPPHGLAMLADRERKGRGRTDLQILRHLQQRDRGPIGGLRLRKRTAARSPAAPGRARARSLTPGPHPACERSRAPAPPLPEGSLRRSCRVGPAPFPPAGAREPGTPPAGGA